MAGSLYRPLEAGLVALKLGLTSFGGPIAHIGYFRREYVERKGWLTDEAFGELTALCQFLPGPASSQLGIAIGIRRAGMLGGIAAWLGFTLPSALLLVFFAIAMNGHDYTDAGWLHGLKLAAVAVVAQAVWSMGRTLAPDRPRIAMAVATASIALLWPGALGQIVPLLLCGIVGAYLLQPGAASKTESFHSGMKSWTATLCLILFVLLLIALPLLAAWHDNVRLQLADIGYRAGSLVFGGGHVVLPMLHEETTGLGLVSDQQFLAGYGATQAVPGPLFTFSAYIGAVSASGTEGLLRAAIMLVSIFLPSYLIVAGVLPYWTRLSAHRRTRAFVGGVNAAVVGLLLAALYSPVFSSTVATATDFVIVLIGFVLLANWRCPPWLIVLLAAVIGWIVYS
ncbi:chromate efflux transporter [Cohnella yongneupensis]|uniref:Chromate efflux transporter n=1 Tax=Cohnella yongneupensis TaxID=425006 RepID=A0ABW0R7T9_9BACL